MWLSWDLNPDCTASKTVASTNWAREPMDHALRNAENMVKKTILNEKSTQGGI